MKLQKWRREGKTEETGNVYFFELQEHVSGAVMKEQKCVYVCCFALAYPGSGRGGGPRIFFRDDADVAKWSRTSKASQYWPGSRASLRALEALAFLTFKYAFSHFSWYVFFKLFHVHLCG